MHQQKGKATISESENQLNIKNNANQIQIPFKCAQKNKAMMFCFKENCKQKCPYTCEISHCKCQKEHGLCGRAMISSVLEFVNSKISETDKIKQQIQVVIDKAVDQLSKIRDKFFFEVDTKLKYAAVSPMQKQFLDQISQIKKQTFNSVKYAKLWQKINQQIDVDKLVKLSRNLIFQNLNKSSNINYNDSLSKILKIIQSYNVNILESEERKIYKLGNNLIKYQQLKQTQRLYNEILEIQTSILNNSQLRQKLFLMFDKKVSSIKKLFKASEHQFKIQKFYQKCGEQSNLLIVCKTQKDKIIGAYTPLSFEAPFKGQSKYISDSTGSSFIFSLTNNHKFKLKSNQYAVYRIGNQSFIQIGNQQLKIGDQTHIKANTKATLSCDNYCNYSYRSNQKQSHFKFNGTQSNQFKLKQWQVYKVSLEN